MVLRCVIGRTESVHQDNGWENKVEVKRKVKVCGKILAV